jgi:glycerol-3-phosphate O-acyltransferase
VAAGANLSFFPLGLFLRRSSAFFLRRSFKGDPIYTATFKAYIKKLVREGQSQEFFIEGTRSRTGKLIQPKTGMLAFEVDAVLEGAQDDLIFVPVSIDYDKLVEARSYARESAGAEKKPESIKSLLAAPKVLATARSGRIYMAFGEPVSLKEFLAARVRDPAAMTPEQKRAAIMALAQRITWGIGRATTVTPAALLAAALLAHRRRGVTAREAGGRIHALRESAAREGIRISPQLDEAPSDPSTLGPVNEVLRRFMEDGLVSAQVVGSDTLYTVPDDKRALLVLYKNSLVHLFATRSFAAFALLSLDGAGTEAEALERFTYLAGMLKLEFSFAHGLHEAETLFREACDALAKEGLLVREAGRVALAPAPHAREDLAFLANLNRDLLESYRCFFSSLKRLNGPADRKALIAHALETGRAEFLSGTLGCAEALSRPTFENALALCVESGALTEQDKKFALGPSLAAPGAIDVLLARLDRFLFRD